MIQVGKRASKGRQ